MSRTFAVTLVAACLVLYVVLFLPAWLPLPGPVRLAVAFAVLLLMPGGAFVALGARPPGGAWLAPGWALGLGIAWNAALVLAVTALGQPWFTLQFWAPFTSVLPWALVIQRGRGPASRREEGLPRAAALAILLAVLVATVHVARLGPVVSFSSDAPDHIGTLARMLQTGELFPTDTFFRDAGRLGADPRKGVWHGLMALLSRLADVEPATCWRWLGALIVPFLVWNVAALGMLCRGPTGAALAAWLLLLTYGGGLARTPIRHVMLASSLVDQLAVAALVAILLDLRRRVLATRLAAAALAFAAVATHVFAAIHFALVLPALALGLLVRDRRPGPELKRLGGTAALLGLVSLPYLVFRLLQSYGPANVIHAQPQGLTFLAGGWSVVAIGQLWEWAGPAWVLVPLAWPWLWTRGRGNTAALHLLTASLAVAVILFDPPAVRLLQPRLGYLLMRMLSLVPLAVLIAWLLPEGLAVLRAGGPARRRWGGGAVVAVALVLLAPLARDAVQVLLDPGLLTTVERRESPARWRAEFEWMERRMDSGTVVLSDPATSYLVPMATGLRVVTTADQHGSPNDTLAVRRLLDARDALDPFGSWERTRAVVRRYGVGAIVLNDRFVEPPRLDYWAPGPAWYRAARERFDRRPAAFPRLLDVGDFVVYGIRRDALDTLSAPARPRAFVAPWPLAAARSAPGAEGAPPVLLDLALAPAVAAPGESVVGVGRWHAGRPAGPGACQVVVRFDRDLPDGLRPPSWIGKPVRKLVEAVRHERYRFRVQHAPAGGLYGVDLWRPDEIVQDSFGFRVPVDAADGTYRVQVRMLRDPHYPNSRLADWFFDRDSYSGEAAGTFEVRRGARAAGQP